MLRNARLVGGGFLAAACLAVLLVIPVRPGSDRAAAAAGPPTTSAPPAPAAEPAPRELAEPTPETPAVPNLIVLVTIDTLREDYVSYLHPARPTTPFLDTLARRGVYFSGCRAPSSWTPPSMASIFTGLYPSSHGVVNGIVVAGGVEGQTKLSGDLTTLAELLRGAGYRTIGVPCNLHLQAKMGFAQGFDVYWPNATFENAGKVHELVFEQLRKAYGPGFRKTWKSRKTFLWIHYFDPHDPYFANEPFVSRIDPGYAKDPDRYPAAMSMPQLRERYESFGPELMPVLSTLYGSEVAFVDERLRILVRDLGLDDPRVLLVVTSDHGEELADHGDIGHARTLHEEVLRVPMLWHWPGAFPAGTVLEERVSLVDVLPTIAELVAVPLPQPVAGRSLAPSLRQGAAPFVGPSFASLHAPRPEYLAHVDGRWKALVDCATKRTKLFDLESDPAERTDLAASDPVRTKQMEARALAWLSGLPGPPPAELVPIDEAVHEQMESLGYIGDR